MKLEIDFFNCNSMCEIRSIFNTGVQAFKYSSTRHKVSFMRKSILTAYMLGYTFGSGGSGALGNLWQLVAGSAGGRGKWAHLLLSGRGMEGETRVKERERRGGRIS